MISPQPLEVWEDRRVAYLLGKLQLVINHSQLKNQTKRRLRCFHKKKHMFLEEIEEAKESDLSKWDE